MRENPKKIRICTVMNGTFSLPKKTILLTFVFRHWAFVNIHTSVLIICSHSFAFTTIINISEWLPSHSHNTAKIRMSILRDKSHFLLERIEYWWHVITVPSSIDACLFKCFHFFTLQLSKCECRTETLFLYMVGSTSTISLSISISTWNQPSFFCSFFPWVYKNCERIFVDIFLS